MLVISRGSTSNVDPLAEELSSGHSQLKAFDLSNVTASGYDFDSEGMLLGWGLRNSVGVVEHPDTGGIYSVENSVDEIMREGKDVHQDNPGEEMVSRQTQLSTVLDLLGVRTFTDISMALNTRLKAAITGILIASLHG